MLLDAIRLVASDFDTQVRALPPEMVCTADEIAITYGDCFLLADQIVSAGLITAQVYNELKVLDDLFERMSGQDHANLWTLDALRNGAEWKMIRAKAAELLDRLGVPYAPPNPGNWKTFVPSRRLSDGEDGTEGIEFDDS